MRVPRWMIMVLVVGMVVAIVVFDVFPPALWWVLAGVLAAALLVYAALRLIEWRHLRAQREEAFAALARQRAADR